MNPYHGVSDKRSPTRLDEEPNGLLVVCSGVAGVRERSNRPAVAVAEHESLGTSP